jgi:hypothetical protein
MRQLRSNGPQLQRRVGRVCRERAVSVLLALCGGVLTTDAVPRLQLRPCGDFGVLTSLLLDPARFTLGTLRGKGRMGREPARK